MKQCSDCNRPDFASGIRCQWCGNYFDRAGVNGAVAAPSARGTAVSDAAADSMVLASPAVLPAIEAAPRNGAISTGTVAVPGSDGQPTPFSTNGAFASSHAAVPDDDSEQPQRNGLKKLLPFLAPLFLLLSKAKAILVFLKLGKFLTTGASMLVSIGFYAMFYGWAFGVGLVLLILVHELGHVVVIKRKGLPASAPIFIPFLGAAIFLKQRPQDPLTDAQISYGGPFLGSVGAAICYLVYLQTQNPLWLVYAHTGFFLNLFNLTPATPLDGGWIVKAISPKMWLAGAVLAIGIGFWIHSTLLVIIAVFSLFRAWGALRDDDEDDEVHRLAPRARLQVTAAYLGLALFLGIFIAHTTHLLEGHRGRHQNPEPRQIALLGGEAR